MTARRVVCPGCQTTLQIPATMQAGKIKCPKCQKVLAIRAPASPAQPSTPAARPASAPKPAPGSRPTPGSRPAATRPAAAMPVARPIPQPVRKPAAPADPFGDLPDFGSAPAYGNAPAGNAGFGFPPAQPPARPMTPNYRTGPAPAAPKRKKASGGGNQLVKILGIIGGVGVLCVLLCAGGIFGLAYLGTRHSGWTTEQFQGYTIDMPAGKDRKTQSQQRPLTTIHELSARRKETGSQYSLLVAKVPGGGANMSVEDMIRSMQLLVFDDRSITRDGVRGVAGKMAGSSQGAQASEAEIFLHNGNLVVAMYSAYSKIQFAVGGTRDPRKNERDLDKPDEFFASLQFQ